MKSLKHLFCLLASLSFVFSSPVELQEAEAVALNKFPNKKIERTEKTSNELYLTTFENGGFVLTSADKGFPAILAYSKDAPSGNNPAFSDLCKNYSRQIAALKSENREQHSDWDLADQNSLNKVSVTSAVQPLITSKWDQAPHYNNQFPYFVLPGHTDERAYVGCVAVVMGQLMNYYEHPPRGYGKRWNYSASTDSLLEVWHDTTWYDYENMPDSLCNKNGVLTAYADQVEDVSLFLYQCAVSVDMEFFPEGSSSAYEDMMYALTSYFDYNTEMVQKIYTDHSVDDWKQMIVDELNAGYPVPYRGSGDGSGHAFLLDGYETTTNTYYHFNWGWRGYYDGWFLLSALNPADGHDYTQGQAAVFNIRPNPDNLTRYAYTSFEGYQSGWSYSGGVGYTIGEDDLIYAFIQDGQWLKSPKIHIPDNNNATFMVDALKIGNGTKECRVMISHTDTMSSSFTTEIGRITPGVNWSTYPFSLRSYKGSDVYFGLEYLTETSGNIILDDLTVWIPKVVIETADILPDDFDLLNVYPNPFNPRTAVSYRLSAVSDVQIDIFDLKGNNVLTLLDGVQEAGAYKLSWDASGFPSGLYICSLSINNKLIESQKILLVK